MRGERAERERGRDERRTYGCKTSGTFTPSGVWWFSTIAQMVLVVAHSVEFSMCTNLLLSIKCIYYFVV